MSTIRWLGFSFSRAGAIGLGAAAAVPSAQSILSATYDDAHKRNIAFAAWGASGAVGYTYVFSTPTILFILNLYLRFLAPR